MKKGGLSENMKFVDVVDEQGEGVDRICISTKDALYSTVKNTDGSESRAKGGKNLRAVKTFNRVLERFLPKFQQFLIDENLLKIVGSLANSNTIQNLLERKLPGDKALKVFTNFLLNASFQEYLKTELDRYQVKGSFRTDAREGNNHLEEILSIENIYAEIFKLISIARIETGDSKFGFKIPGETIEEDIFYEKLENNLAQNTETNEFVLWKELKSEREILPITLYKHNNVESFKYREHIKGGLENFYLFEGKVKDRVEPIFQLVSTQTGEVSEIIQEKISISDCDTRHVYQLGLDTLFTNGMKTYLAGIKGVYTRKIGFDTLMQKDGGLLTLADENIGYINIPNNESYFLEKIGGRVNKSVFRDKSDGGTTGFIYNTKNEESYDFVFDEGTKPEVTQNGKLCYIQNGIQRELDLQTFQETKVEKKKGLFGNILAKKEKFLDYKTEEDFVKFGLENSLMKQMQSSSELKEKYIILNDLLNTLSEDELYRIIIELLEWLENFEKKDNHYSIEKIIKELEKQRLFNEFQFKKEDGKCVDSKSENTFIKASPNLYSFEQSISRKMNVIKNVRTEEVFVIGFLEDDMKALKNKVALGKNAYFVEGNGVKGYMSPSQDTLYYIEKGFGGDVLKSVEIKQNGLTKESEMSYIFVIGDKSYVVGNNNKINDFAA